MCNTQVLDLGGNQFGDPGVTALAQACAGGALAQCQRLVLAENKIGDPGLASLADACARGALAQLEDLYLGGNTISDKTKGIMETAMANRTGSVHF